VHLNWNGRDVFVDLNGCDGLVAEVASYGVGAVRSPRFKCTQDWDGAGLAAGCPWRSSIYSRRNHGGTRHEVATSKTATGSQLTDSRLRHVTLPLATQRLLSLTIAAHHNLLSRCITPQDTAPHAETQVIPGLCIPADCTDIRTPHPGSCFAKNRAWISFECILSQLNGYRKSGQLGNSE
jgi:hypothetical protein